MRTAFSFSFLFVNFTEGCHTHKKFVLSHNAALILFPFRVNGGSCCSLPATDARDGCFFERLERLTGAVLVLLTLLESYRGPAEKSNKRPLGQDH